jgi:hypothetical protein
MKAYWGSECIAPRILDLVTRRRRRRRRSVVRLTPQPLYPHGKNPQYPLDRRLGDHRAGLDAVVKREIPSAR